MTKASLKVTDVLTTVAAEGWRADKIGGIAARSHGTRMIEKFAISMIAIGCFLAGSGLLCLSLEALRSIRDGHWHTVQAGAILAHFAHWAPESPSGSSFPRLFYGFLDLPLYQVLLAAGLGLIVIGLAVLR